MACPEPYGETAPISEPPPSSMDGQSLIAIRREKSSPGGPLSYVETEAMADAVSQSSTRDGSRLLPRRFDRRQHAVADNHAPTAILEGTHDGSDADARDRRYRRTLAAADLVATALALLA